MKSKAYLFRCKVNASFEISKGTDGKSVYLCRCGSITLKKEEIMKMKKFVLLSVLAFVGIVSGYGVWILFGRGVSNPHGCAVIGDIPVPRGYHRVAETGNSAAEFMRSLPLKERGSKLMLYTGGESRLQSLNYAVVDLPLLSNYEQCADVCMRLRAEYLYNTGQYGKIHFQDVNGKTLRYNGGRDRKAFEKYLRNLYGVASTFSLSREMKHRRIADMRIGDVFVYAAPAGQKYGHAVMVVDIAVNDRGQTVFMLAEGNTPARSIHVIRNFKRFSRTPWMSVDDDAESFWLSLFHYEASDLRCF